jgi:hypothetical protein
MSDNRDRIYTIGPVTITRHLVDWPNLGPDLKDFAALTYNRYLALLPLSPDHRYLNPMFSLFAPSEVPEDVFLRQANRACILWMKQLKKVASQRRIRRFQLRESTAGERMMVTSGFLVLSGKEAHITRLNEAEVKTNAC